MTEWEWHNLRDFISGDLPAHQLLSFFVAAYFDKCKDTTKRMQMQVFPQLFFIIEPGLACKIYLRLCLHQMCCSGVCDLGRRLDGYRMVCLSVLYVAYIDCHTGKRDIHWPVCLQQLRQPERHLLLCAGTAWVWIQQRQLSGYSACTSRIRRGIQKHIPLVELHECCIRRILGIFPCSWWASSQFPEANI